MNNLIEGKTGSWEVVIGLEVHAQITSKSKLFSSSKTEFGAGPNEQVSFIDAAMPGMLPTINKFCIEQAVKTGLGLNSTINLTSIFDRKNYFYADLPQGYQISQFSDPIVSGGKITIDLPDGSTKDIKITRLHLEQDAGKSLHDQSPKHSFIDLNRAGIALMEIVSEPDIRSSYEAGEYLKKLRSIVRYLETCDGDMEKGSLRCDANVSVRKPGAEYGTRCEIKNLNSIKNLIKAVDYEIERQIEVLESGGVINQETRLFDVDTGETRTMRTKEDAHDYRYFPDPDLLPLKLTSEYVENIRKSLPELPDEKINRYQSELGLSKYDATVLTADKEIAEYFEQVATGRDAKTVSNWISAELFARLKKNDLSIYECKISASKFGKLIDLIESKVISGKIAKQVLDIMFETGEDADKIVESEGLTQVTDNGAIEKIIDEVLSSNQDKVLEYRSGKEKLYGFFVGQIMKLSAGKANPEILNNLLKEKLSK
ncbi:MAG: Asp-tRNA(Asn)/Glu-tRNA(Gln) amidotransferase subunit GatB [Alphaproteobacteria bacterium]